MSIKEYQDRALLENQLPLNFNGDALVLRVAATLDDAPWAARYGHMQSVLRLGVYEGRKFRKFKIDLTACIWADPLPLLAIAISLLEFERLGGHATISLSAIETSSKEKKRFLKFLAREGFLDLFSGKKSVELGGSSLSSGSTRCVLVGGELLTPDILDRLKQINVSLVFERSTCLPATVIELINPEKCENALGQVDKWVDRKFFEAISPVVSDMVPSWAQRSIRTRIITALREILHNSSEHAYSDFGWVAVYVRYREGALGLSPREWRDHKLNIKRENSQSIVPLMEAPSDQESFAENRAGFFELYIIDSGCGLCDSLGENEEQDVETRLRVCMRDVLEAGRGRRPTRPTHYGGLYLLRQLLEPNRDFFRIRDGDAWWGTELPLKLTENGSTPSGTITRNARGKEHVYKAIQGVAWTLRISWLEPTDKVDASSPWQGLGDSKDNKHRELLLSVLSEKRKYEESQSCQIFDWRFIKDGNRPRQAAMPCSAACDKSVVVLPKPGWTKHQIQFEIKNIVDVTESQFPLDVVVFDIPSEDAAIYQAAIAKSSYFHVDKISNISRIVLVTRDLRSCVFLRVEEGIFDVDVNASYQYPRSLSLSPSSSLARCYSVVRHHDGDILWKIILRSSSAYLAEYVRWSEKVTIEGYLDFSQSLTHPICREIYFISLQRIKGLLPSLNCTMTGLDGLVDSLVIRFNAQQHPKRRKGVSGPQSTKMARVNIGSVQVSGATEHADRDCSSHLFYFFKHPSGTGKGNYLLPWLSPPFPDQKKNKVCRYARVGRTAVVARDGWKAYQMPRYSKDEKSIYAQPPSASYRAWQEPSRTPLKLGHWTYGGHHDLLTLNLLLAFDTELDHISLELGGTLARFLYLNLFDVLGLKYSDLTSTGKSIIEAAKRDDDVRRYPKSLGEQGALLIYPSHPVTDHVIDKFLSLILDEPDDETNTSSLQRVRDRIIPVLPIRRHRSGSGLQISGLILERLQSITDRRPVVIFDDALISGRTYSDIKRLLRNIGFDSFYSLCIVDRQRFPSADQAFAANHICYWRLDVPSLGGKHRCSICSAIRRLNDFSKALTPQSYRDRLESWKESWRPTNPTTEWGDGGLHPIPLSLLKPERKFSIKPTPGNPSHYAQIGGDRNLISLTNTAGLIAYLSELHSITSHDDLAMRVLAKEEKKFTPEAQIQVLASQLLLFSGEFDRDLALDLGRALLAALWNADTYDRHTSLAALTLIGCGDAYLKEVVIYFFRDREHLISKASSKNLDLVLLLAMVVANDTAMPDQRLIRLREQDSLRGLLQPSGKIELYGWLHRVIRDSSGKPHSTPFQRFIDWPPSDFSDETLKNAMNSCIRFESIVKNVQPYWLRDECVGRMDYGSVMRVVDQESAELVKLLKSILGQHLDGQAQCNRVNDAKEKARRLFDIAKEFHEGIFCQLGLEEMKKEGGKVSLPLLKVLAEVSSSLYSGKKIKWHIPSRIEIANGVSALNKPGMGEVYILWDSGIYEAIKDILSNVRHACEEIKDPWRESSPESALLWGRFSMENEFICIELRNKTRESSEVAVRAFNDKQHSFSKVLLKESGCRIGATSVSEDVFQVTIRIPYAHTLPQK